MYLSANTYLLRVQTKFDYLGIINIQKWRSDKSTINYLIN